MKEFCSLTC